MNLKDLIGKRLTDVKELFSGEVLELTFENDIVLKIEEIRDGFIYDVNKLDKKSEKIDKCQHKWRVNRYAFEEGCIGAVCIKCGIRGCVCNVKEDNNGEIPENFWNEEGDKYVETHREVENKFNSKD